MRRYIGYIANFWVAILFLVGAGLINLYTSLAGDDRDDSVMVWEGSCVVSAQIAEGGLVVFKCPSGESSEDQIRLAGTVGIDFVANTTISDRFLIPNTCQNFESGRWICKVGDVEEFTRVNVFDPEEESEDTEVEEG